MSFKRLFHRETLWLGFWLLAGLVSVVAYNAWMVCCGACSPVALITFGWSGWSMLTANLAAAVILVILKWSNYRKIQVEKCHCGVSLRGGWNHCPGCGRKMS